MLSAELRPAQKEIKARDNRTAYPLKQHTLSQHIVSYSIPIPIPIQITNTETAGLEPGAVFRTLGSFLCEVWGSTAAVGACWEAQGGCWSLRSSSWGSGSQCPPGSPSGPGIPSGPVSSAGSAVPSTVAHSGSFLILKFWWSNPAGGTSRRVSSLVYLCSFPDEFAGRTDGGCTGDRLCSALRVALVPTWTDLQREETEKDTRAIPTAREHACNYLLLLFV